MKASEIAALVQLRAFLFTAVDNLNIRLSREEVKGVQAKCTQLDRAIIENSLKLDLTAPEVPELEDSALMFTMLDSKLTDITSLLKGFDIKENRVVKQAPEKDTKKTSKKPVKGKFTRSQTVEVASTVDIGAIKLEELDSLVK